MTKNFLPLVLIFLMLIGCADENAEPTAAITRERVQQLATQHRDQWLVEHSSEDAKQLARGVVHSVEEIDTGWHVTFATHTGGGPGEEEGMHVYFLHVYLKPDGELDKVVRGPDLLS